MTSAPVLTGESDALVGKRTRLKRYLVCAMEGYFPVAVRTGPTSLVAVVRCGAPHLGILGTIAATSSQDGGKSWSDPAAVQPRGLDCRNPSLGVNARGELVLAFWKAGLHSYVDEPGGPRYSGAPDPRWDSVTALYTCASSDGGCTWSEAVGYRADLLSQASPYGRMLTLPDGGMLMGVYGHPRGVPGASLRSILLRSTDGGLTWGDESLVAEGYNETAYLLLPDGSLLAAARSENGHVATLRSADLGRTWSRPEQITRDGEQPGDLTLLASGRVLLAFGRRIRPLGCGALLSDDSGHTWDTDHEVLLAGDGGGDARDGRDVGYTSTVQLADGQIVTLLYYASGSEMSEHWGGWGRVSCQAIHYREDDIRQ
ncbi:MAG: sialidase family protein [Anaerolineae bacterium]